MLKGLGGLGDMAKMMKAAGEMQSKMAEMQEVLANTIVTGEAGAGLVRVRATAKPTTPAPMTTQSTCSKAMPFVVAGQFNSK